MDLKINMENTTNKIFYSPYNKNFTHPGDRRRFYGYLNKLKIEKSLCSNYKNAKIIYLTNSKNTDLSFFYRYLKTNNKLFAFDLADAYLLEDISLRKIFRSTYKFIKRENKYLHFSQTNLIKKMCKIANVIICSSENQKKEILKYNKNVFIINDFLDNEIYNYNSDLILKNNILNIFWEGQSNNIQEFDDIANTIIKFNKMKKIKMHFVTDKTYVDYNKVKRKTISYLEKKFLDVEFTLHNWSIKSVNDVSQKCDIAIIPSANRNKNMFKNKSANKLHICWKLGLPTITSFNSAYKKSMNEIGVDMICYKNQDWLDKLSFCFNNFDTLNADRQKAYTYVNNNFSDKVILSSWNKVLKKIDINKV